MRVPVEAAVQHAIGAPSPQEIAEQDLTGDALLAHELHQQVSTTGHACHCNGRGLYVHNICRMRNAVSITCATNKVTLALDLSPAFRGSHDIGPSEFDVITMHSLPAAIGNDVNVYLLSYFKASVQNQNFNVDEYHKSTLLTDIGIIIQMEDDFLQPKDELNDEGWEAVLPKKKRQGARTGAGRGNAPGPQGRIGRARIR